MALDLTAAALQIDSMSLELKAREGDRGRRLESACQAIASTDAAEYERRRGLSRDAIAWSIPETLDDPGARREPPAAPADFRIVAVDGSHIDVDRHIPARCYLINVGVSTLTYGADPDAELRSEPTLYAGKDDLVMRDRNNEFKEQAIEGAVLGAKRTVEEIRFLAQSVRGLPGETPTLALMDGSLIMLGLLGRGYDDFVRRELIDEGFAQSLEELRLLSQARRLAVASYISLPRSAEVVNALRMVVCPYETSRCDYHCGAVRMSERPCEAYAGDIMDRDLWARMLTPGQRSALFLSTSPLVENHYGGHGVCFFYLHVGAEIARVEVPSWTAEDEASLDLAHSLIYDQCLRGPGYPAALMEAHEQAVITGADRQRFAQLVEEASASLQTAHHPSGKSISKRLRWL